MKLSEQLAALKTKRAALVTKMQGIYEGAEKDERTFDETEQKTFDDSKGEIAAIDRQVGNVEELMRLDVAKATPIIVPPGAAAGGAPLIVSTRQLPKGTAFTRYTAALALSKGSLHQAVEIAKRWEDSTPEVVTVLRAAVAAGTTTDPAWAKPLVEYTQMADEFIELLRPNTFLGRMNGFRRVPFNVRIPRQTAGASVGWVGEGAPKPVSKLALDAIVIPWAKVAGIVVITEELARFSSPSAEALVRQDLIDTTGQFLDQLFVNPTIAAVAGVSPGSITNGAPTIPMAGATVAQITAALGAAINAMATSGVSMRSPYWLMHTTTATQLGLLRTAQDVFAFRDEMAQGKLIGVPFLASADMPILTGTPDSTYIVLIECSEVLLADDGPVMIDVSREASLQLDSAPANPPTPLVSLWQQNMLGIKAELYRYWLRRRNTAVQVITGVPLTIAALMSASAPPAQPQQSGGKS